MPTRLLREGILSSERVNALGDGAEVFYRRLMSVVDDYGRFEAHPTFLLARLYPLRIDRLTSADMSRWLQECLDAGLILSYEVDHKQYLQIDNFGQRTRSRSKYPSPPGETAGERRIITESPSQVPADDRNVLAQDCNVLTHDRDVLTSARLARATNTHTPTSPTANGKEGSRRGEGVRGGLPTPEIDIEQRFLALKAAYASSGGLVSRVNDCRAAYRNLLVGAVDPVTTANTIDANVYRYAEYCRAVKKIPLGLHAWLTGGDCLSPPPTPPPKPKSLLEEA